MLVLVLLPFIVQLSVLHPFIPPTEYSQINFFYSARGVRDMRERSAQISSRVSRLQSNDNNNNNTLVSITADSVCTLYDNNNSNLSIYSALFNMLGDQKRITTINNLKTVNTNIRNIQRYLISKRY